MKKTERTGSPLKWIIKSIKKQLPVIIFLVILNSILACCNTFAALTTKYVIDNAVNKNKQMFLIFLAVLIGIYLFNIIFSAVSNYITERCRSTIEMNMKANFFEKIARKNYDEISSYHSGTLLNRLISDVSVITNCVTSIFPNFFALITRLVFAFVVVVSFEPWFAVVFGVGGLFVFFATKLMRSKLKKLHKDVQSEEDKVRSFWQESLSNLLAVKVFSNEGNMAEKSDKLQQNLFKAKMKKARFSVVTSSGYSTGMICGYLFALAWCSVKLMVDVTFTYGSFTSIMQLISQIQQPFSSISGIIPQYYNAIASAERIMEIEDIEEEDNNDSDFDPELIYNKFKCIKINDLTFYYKKEKETVFKNVNYKIDKGDFVAIVGHSGIGKSTLFKIMLGVYTPKGGSIDIVCDDATYTCSPSTRKLFSYVPQGNLIFSGSIRDNITFINDNVSDEQIDVVLKLSCADEFVEKLPNGLDTLIGEKGLGLSEGQVQRIAIARALLSDAPILLLDEATSALDAVTEAKVLENLMSLETKTCIIVTHRKQALNICNKKWEIKS